MIKTTFWKNFTSCLLVITQKLSTFALINKDKNIKTL